MERTDSPPPSNDKKKPSPPPPELPPPQSPQLRSYPQPDREAFATNFTALYHSIFPPKPPPLPSSLSLSPSTSESPTSDDVATDRRLHQARLILEHQELSEHYDLCLLRLHALAEELESLRIENADLRLENAELLDLLSISSSINKRRNNVIASPDTAHLERRDPDRVALPESIPVRSSGYVSTPCSASTRPRVPSQFDQVASDSAVVQGQRKVYVAGGEEAAMELEVYNQGTRKTELCNKWQETGVCPYGENCQFAHGITELLPVIRHPRYKTQACRMVLAGKICPYGHRCHFRHSLAEHELLMAPR